MAQLTALPLTVSCFSKIQIDFTFLVPAHPGSPEKGPLNGGVCGMHKTVENDRYEDGMTEDRLMSKFHVTGPTRLCLRPGFSDKSVDCLVRCGPARSVSVAAYVWRGVYILNRRRAYVPTVCLALGSNRFWCIPQFFRGTNTSKIVGHVEITILISYCQWIQMVRALDSVGNVVYQKLSRCLPDLLASLRMRQLTLRQSRLH